MLSRLLADPAFLFKLTLEQGFTIGYGIWWECQHCGKGKQKIPYLYRKDLWWKLSYQERTHLFLGLGRIRKEWDVATENALTVAVCNMAICWSLAPSWSYGSTFEYKFQNTIQKIPINVFDKSHPLREFYVQRGSTASSTKLRSSALLAWSVG
jgi:hypothetical protein